MIGHTTVQKLQNNSDFGLYLLDFSLKWIQKLSYSKNMKKLTHSWIRLIFPHILVPSDFHPYGIHFKICATWVKIWWHQNVRESQVDATVRKKTPYFRSTTLLTAICVKSRKKKAMWVEIWGHQNVRKNEADPVVSKSLSYFSRNRTFEAILLQNQANMPQNHCYFANYVPLCVQSRKY